MKIDLTKEEWEFLRKYMNCENDIPLLNHDFTKTWQVLESIIKKLGNEWVEDAHIK